MAIYTPLFPVHCQQSTIDPLRLPLPYALASDMTLTKIVIADVNLPNETLRCLSFRDPHADVVGRRESRWVGPCLVGRFVGGCVLKRSDVKSTTSVTRSA